MKSTDASEKYTAFTFRVERYIKQDTRMEKFYTCFKGVVAHSTSSRKGHVMLRLQKCDFQATGYEKLAGGKFSLITAE